MQLSISINFALIKINVFNVQRLKIIPSKRPDFLAVHAGFPGLKTGRLLRTPGKVNLRHIYCREI